MSRQDQPGCANDQEREPLWTSLAPVKPSLASAGSWVLIKVSKLQQPQGWKTNMQMASYVPPHQLVLKAWGMMHFFGGFTLVRLHVLVAHGQG